MATSKDVIKSFTIKVNTKDGKVKIDGISKSFEDAGKAFDGLQNKMKKGLPQVSQQMDGIARSSGGAAASVTEFGRVISDAPYGIRGVANNLSQLASNLALTAKKAGGFSGAMKSLGAAFMGPLGILVAIQTALAVLEAWSMRTKEANVAAEVFGSSITENAAKLNILVQALNDTNLTTEQQISIMQNNKEGLEELGFEVGNTADSMDRLRIAMEKEIVVMKKRAIAQGFANVIQEKSNEIAEAVAQGVEGNLKWYESTAIQLGLTSQAFAGLTKEQIKQVVVGQKLVKMNETITGAYDMLTKTLDDGDMYINYLMDGGKKNGAGKRARALKIFKQQFLDLQRIILQNEKQLSMDAERYELDRIKVQGQFAQDEIDLKLDTFKEKQAIRLREYLASIEGHQREAELAAEANRKYIESIKDAEVEAGEAKLAIRENYSQKYRLKEEEILERQRTGVATDSLGRLADAEALADPFAADANNELVEARRQARLRDIDDRLKDERVGTDAYYAILKERLDFVKKVNQEEYQSELDKINKKKAINMQYADFLMTTSSILKNIANENEGMQKLALMVEKGAAVAKVVIGAQASIEARKAQHNAIPTFINVPSPTGMISIPNPAKAADKVAMLKANLMTKVGAGLSIANILSQTIKKKGSIKDGGGKDAAGGREFDFNLVGSTGENQLAQATAGQLNQPVQAYVVSSEITSQQQLDNTIQTNASFGDDD